MITLQYSEEELVEQRTIVDSSLKLGLLLNNLNRGDSVEESTRLLTQDEMDALYLMSHQDFEQIRNMLKNLLSMLRISAEAKILNHPERRAELWLHPKGA